MSRILYLLIFLFSLSSCIKNCPTFTVVNRSGAVIDSLTISNLEGYSKTFRSIEPGAIVDGCIDMQGTPPVDGSYGLYVYQEGKRVVKGFGYYTNGASLDYHFGISVERDSIIIRQFDPLSGLSTNH